MSIKSKRFILLGVLLHVMQSSLRKPQFYPINMRNFSLPVITNFKEKSGAPWLISFYYSWMTVNWISRSFIHAPCSAWTRLHTVDKN